MRSVASGRSHVLRAGLLPRWRADIHVRYHHRGAQEWSPVQYLKFEKERTRPARDLLANVLLRSAQRIVDLGCGPGNSTAVLQERYSTANLSGLDSSSTMLSAARKNLPDINFELMDLNQYTPDESVDLFFSNAVFQWVEYGARIPIMKRLIESQPSGGVFAFQVPDNYLELSHLAMRSLAAKEPWGGDSEKPATFLGSIPDSSRPL